MKMVSVGLTLSIAWWGSDRRLSTLALHLMVVYVLLETVGVLKDQIEH